MKFPLHRGASAIWMMRRRSIRQVTETTAESSRRNNFLPRGEQLFKRNRAMDLSKLTDEEIKLLERLMLKAAGELVGDVAPPFRVEFVNRRCSLTP
jgi:hypothetical protein